MPDAQLLHLKVRGRTVQDIQSDRTYPPFFSLMDEVEETYDPRNGGDHLRRSIVFINTGPTRPMAMSGTADASYAVRDSAIPMPQLHSELQSQRLMNPWAIVQDWVRSHDDLRFEGRCMYRDQWRMVVSRQSPEGRQRLFLDEDSHLPVKQDWTVFHLTWGQRHMEALWSTWINIGEDQRIPGASFVLADGRVERERTVGLAELLSPEEAGVPALPAAPTMTVDRHLSSWLGGVPDTVRIADDTYLLAHPGYNEAVTLVGDTVVVLDATSSEDRARADSAWVARLFPGPHPVKVVVTDLAWPHIGGVRFWVARGATIVSHKQSESFLREVVERRWTLKPDALERARADRPVPFRFQAVDDNAELAGGAVRLTTIDGIGGEGALIAWMPAHAFLWAGDFIQDLRGPSLYAGEVMRAVRREGFRPDRFGAQHLPLAAWSKVEDANPQATR